MLILGIDTSGSAVAAALLEGERVLAAEAERAGRRGAPALGTLLDRLWSSTGTAPSSLQGVAVAEGPGSFTALRVGLGAAAGLAAALGLPLRGVPTHEALAAAAAKGEELLITLLDAGRGEVWAAGHRGGAWEFTDRVLPPADLPDALPSGPLRLVGPGAERYRGLLEREFGEEALLQLPDAAAAEQVARLALPGLRAGGPPPRARYLRPPDAVLSREER